MVNFVVDRGETVVMGGVGSAYAGTMIWAITG
jgi:hypothetical protein